MDNKDNSKVISTVVLGVFIAIAILVVVYFGNLIGPAMKETTSRTSSIDATVTYAEPGGFGMVIKYQFRFESRDYKGEANCSRCLQEYTQAKTGKVTVWFDPQNPNNSNVEKPKTGMANFLKILYWGLIITFVLTYLVFLKNTWGKKKDPTLAEMSGSYEEGTLPGKQHGKGCQCSVCSRTLWS